MNYKRIQSIWSKVYIIEFFRVIFNKGRFYYSSIEWGITKFYNWSLVKCKIMIIRWHVCKNWKLLPLYNLCCKFSLQERHQSDIYTLYRNLYKVSYKYNYYC